MVEIARDHEIARVAEEARDAKTAELREIESPIVDRRDAVPGKASIEIQQMTVVVTIAGTPGLTAVD
jgi:hypothetical protein